MDDQNTDGSLGYTVLHNFSCQHAAPTFINLMNSAILRLATGNKNMTIQTRNYPLPMTQSQHLQRHVTIMFYFTKSITIHDSSRIDNDYSLKFMIYQLIIMQLIIID